MFFPHFRRHWRNAGLSGIREYVTKHIYRNFSSHPSDYIYEHEWDLMVVLDACRLDLLQSVKSEYSFIGSVDQFDSPASHSVGWIKENFSEKYADIISNTAYITGNPHTDKINEEIDFEYLYEGWKHAWDKSLGTVPPRPLTDKTIDYCRAESPDRTIVHYMQPHAPFISDGELIFERYVDRSEDGRYSTEWPAFQRDEIDIDEFWQGYQDALRCVLDDVALLLENVNANRVVITADHGNSLGEKGIYEHPPGVPLSSLREVPWVKTAATDTNSYEPDRSSTADSNISVEEKLEALGYK